VRNDENILLLLLLGSATACSSNSDTDTPPEVAADLLRDQAAFFEDICSASQICFPDSQPEDGCSLDEEGVEVLSRNPNYRPTNEVQTCLERTSEREVDELIDRLECFDAVFRTLRNCVTACDTNADCAGDFDRQFGICHETFPRSVLVDNCTTIAGG
jgi:hypothetical protein